MSIQFVKIAAVVLGYWTISISMVFANKYLVNDRQSTEGSTTLRSLDSVHYNCVCYICSEYCKRCNKRGLEQGEHHEEHGMESFHGDYVIVLREHALL